ncbi:type I inositol 1,4,5-trisphosphate 5-phosphatase 12-like protein, putative [Babesia ovata]|uniref:Type I inositol 1,4,5-trisphosphate 5-phosphatase 12-like protein, putative n=1 Tax=Babesia ovata TaxID=189622 RepID=A0A2H6KK16_9APIC|nr:type I inositol 1,4,5-trisphosphate 5-phosphatase 12-like protein, putative [Babesia ovata]GBE63336.1 type I inositol 1,4,5-trisphosphate 5-phosphatase 12-like protein, putative [Babesia ovata]
MAENGDQSRQLPRELPNHEDEQQQLAHETQHQLTEETGYDEDYDEIAEQSRLALQHAYEEFERVFQETPEEQQQRYEQLIRNAQSYRPTNQREPGSRNVERFGSQQPAVVYQLTERQRIQAERTRAINERMLQLAFEGGYGPDEDYSRDREFDRLLNYNLQAMENTILDYNPESELDTNVGYNQESEPQVELPRALTTDYLLEDDPYFPTSVDQRLTYSESTPTASITEGTNILQLPLPLTPIGRAEFPGDAYVADNYGSLEDQDEEDEEEPLEHSRGMRVIQYNDQPSLSPDVHSEDAWPSPYERRRVRHDIAPETDEEITPMRDAHPQLSLSAHAPRRQIINLVPGYTSESSSDSTPESSEASEESSPVWYTVSSPHFHERT